MIQYKDKIFPDYFIDPVTAIITNSKGEIQETRINERGRPCFKCAEIHQWQVHTHLGYKKGFDIHHLDENKMNNSLSNLVYLSRSEHMKIHNKERQGEKHPMFGKHHSEETKQKMSEAKKNMSDETKKKISEAHKGNTLSEETKRKLSEAMKGENHPLFGKHHSEETKQKMSEAAKRRNKDTIWINNGVENRYIPFDEEIPEGFVRGRLKK